jgi:hypothetical protein
VVTTPHHTESASTAQTTPSPVDSLADALTTERRLLDELITVMRRQRSAVGQDDLQSVDDSVFATHRVLVTLSEARRRRRSLNTLIGQQEDLGLDALDDALGSRMTDVLRQAREDLRRTARVLSHEVSLNRRLLRLALTGGQPRGEP